LPYRVLPLCEMKLSRLAARVTQQLCLVDWSLFYQFDEIVFRDSKVMFV